MKELYLLDNEFLKELDLNLSKTKYVRITSLTFEEEVLQTIEGIATSGSISVDGDSAVRRTCSLSLICEQIDINDFYWGLNTKFKLEVGLENNINPQYPKVVWFPQGIFLITSFSQSVQSNSHIISISGKDKMCLLNGEIGGTIPALSWDFGTEDIESANGVITNVSIPIKRIIRDAVMTFAKERPENIIINDLDDLGVELMEYRGAQPMYMYIGLYSRECSQITLNATQKVYIKENNEIREIDISEVPIFDPCVELNYESMDVDPTPVSMDAEFKTLYTIAKVEYGQTAGYRTTDITYAGDLILSVGDNITNLLDKLKTMLGDFEYYYDLDGRFIFQRKKTYVNVSFNNIVDNREETYVENASTTSAIQYSFVNNQLISSFQNTPNLSNLKNDYSIWGERKSIDGTTTPVHIRYAIDKKPTYYKNFAGQIFCTEDQGKYPQYICDWREIIYQMALDYRQFYYDNDNFYIELRDNNGYDNNGNYRYIDGKTGYEQYYTDLEGFWRQLYCPVGLYTQVYLSEGEYKNAPVDKYFTRTWNEESKSYIYTDIKTEPVQEYDTKTKYFTHGTGYNTLITTNPELLNFWFDFLDNDSEMQKYSVYAIGDRSKNIKDDGVKSIYFRDTPTVIFFDPYKSTNLDRKTGYTYIQCPSYMEQLFSISGQGKSAIDELDNLLYNHAYCIESVSINTIPIYYLVPNTRIFIEDKTTGINGEYIVSKFSYSLSANATMNLTCTKAPERLY